MRENLWFAAMDKSQDGKLQYEEVPENYRELHDLLDVDSDGAVTREELQPLRLWERMRRSAE